MKRLRTLAHRAVRHVTRRYPYTRGSGAVLRMLDRLGLDDRTGLWLETAPFADCPPMALDLRSAFQRRIYYFPFAHQRYYLNSRVRALFARALTPGSTFLDIGANLGFLSFHASSLVGPRGRVYSFEPEPGTFASLARSAALQPMGNVHCIPCALSVREEAPRPLFCAVDGTAHSLHRDKAGSRAVAGAPPLVRITSLDALVSQGEVDVDGLALIKIDVEGEEARTIEGMRETLRRTSGPPIWVEVRGPEGSTRAPDTFAAVMDRVASLGYTAFRLVGDREEPVALGAVRGREDVLLRRTRS